MRELKFRVWDGCESAWAVMRPNQDRQEYTIEQYTGLKDKNGKEIYEGDIVEEEIDIGDHNVDGTYKYKVIWDDEMLCWSLAPNYTSIHKDLWECNQSLKVVGNIHSNPELCGDEEDEL